MKRLLFVLFAAAFLAPAAFAKGPSEASISGPGLDKTIVLAGIGDSSDLTQDTGFFPAVFGQSPDPMLPGRPSGELGPEFTIRYVVPGGNSTSFRLTQELYPYAAGGALTYMKPGQPIFGADHERRLVPRRGCAQADARPGRLPGVGTARGGNRLDAVPDLAARRPRRGRAGRRVRARGPANEDGSTRIGGA